jgi:hypothetical protein
LTAWPLRILLSVAYAYLVEKADAEDSAGVPAYRVAQAEPEDIAKLSARGALDEWLNQPLGDEAAHEKAVVEFLTS